MKKSTKQTVTIKRNEENPEPLEIIAKSIIDVSKAFEAIEKSRVSQRVIVLLIHDKTKIAQRDIVAILDIVPRLKDIYLKRVPGKL